MGTVSSLEEKLHRVRPPHESIDGGGSGGDDGGMETRLKLLEDAMATVKTDLAVIKATHATKADIEGTKASVAEAKTSIIMWVVGAVFLAQLLPALPAILASVKSLSGS